LEAPSVPVERYTTNCWTTPSSKVGSMVHDRVPLRVVGAGSTWSNVMSDITGWAGTLGDESYTGMKVATLTSWRPVTVSFIRMSR